MEDKVSWFLGIKKAGEKWILCSFWVKGFRRFKGFRGFRGEGIAFGDEYIVSVTGLPFVSPVLHDEEQKPPSTGRGWRR